MAKKIYIGVGGVAKNVSKLYIGVGGVAKKVTKGYIGVGGVAKQFYSGSEPIDIGSAATDRASNANVGARTFINADNPANASGTITSVEVWSYHDLTNAIVATFTNVSGTNFTARDSESIGTITAGSKQTFSVTLNVVAGDYIGLYSSTSNTRVEADSSGGSGYWYANGDQTACNNYAFSLIANYIVSLYATGSS